MDFDPVSRAFQDFELAFTGRMPGYFGVDTIYHDQQHTLEVTLAMARLLDGYERQHAGTPAALGAERAAVGIMLALFHDIGYLRGICPGDSEDMFVTDEQGGSVRAPRGASDAFLTPYHIERGKMFVRSRCAHIDYLDAERIARAVELTRFPVPKDNDHAETDTEAGLVRAADLIGQLADPFYPRKLNALYHEFTETGVAEQLGYHSPADVAEHYPRFFWEKVEPYIRDALRHLSRTVEGKQWIANLYAHVFVEEHARWRLGPQRSGRQA